MPVESLLLAPEGPRVSRLVHGLWRLKQWSIDRHQLLRLVEQCLDLGVTTFDHADIYGDYGCEERFGEALALRPELRRRMQLVTKCGIALVSERRPAHRIKHYDTSKAHIVASVERSLRLLRTDVIDVLLLHRPDPLLDADEVAETFAELRRAGKVRHLGVSNFTPRQVELLDSRVEGGLVTNQVECSVLRTEALTDGTLDLAQQRRTAPMAWSPLGGGSLFTGDGERERRVRDTLAAIGAELGGVGIDQVALAWLMAHPARIVPVLGTGKIERIRAAVDAAALTLDRQQWFGILAASTGADVP